MLQGQDQLPPPCLQLGKIREKTGAWRCHGYCEAGLAEKEKVTEIWMHPENAPIGFVLSKKKKKSSFACAEVTWAASQFLVPAPSPSPHPLFAAGPVSTAATEPPEMPLTISFFLPCLWPPPPLSLPTSVPLWGFQPRGASSGSFLLLFRASQPGRQQLLPFFLPLIGSFFVGDSKQTQTSLSLGPPLNPNMFAFLHKSHHIPGVTARLRSALQNALLASPLLPLFLFFPIIIAEGETKPSLYLPSKDNMGEML